MGDIEIATDRLRELARELDTMHGDLVDSDAGAHYSRDNLAHSRVADAMEEFRDNWNDNRSYVADKLKKVGELAVQTADGFEQTDEELAKEINKAVAE